MSVMSFAKKVVKAILPSGLYVLYSHIVKDIRLRKDLKHWEYHFENAKKIEKNKERPLFIITLTSYGKRVKSKAPYTIQSLLAQSLRADKIILWLAHGTEIPKELQKLQEKGLEIRFCEDLKSYKKLIPALKEFPKDVLITADDDIYYPPNWFELLYNSYLKDKEKIYCHRVHEICLDAHKNIIPYNDWRWCIKTIEFQKRIFATSGGGMLFPPNSLAEEVLDWEKIKKLAPTADDIWFWAMGRLKGTEFEIVDNCINNIVSIGLNNEGLWQINLENNKNDEQIQNLIKEYPKILQGVL